MNEDLQALHAQLIAYVLTLARAQENATTVEAIVEIGHEIDEVSHRATLAGKLLFKQNTAALAAAVDAAQNATGDVDKAIADIAKLDRFLTTISEFLGLVDKALDTAKLV